MKKFIWGLILLAMLTATATANETVVTQSPSIGGNIAHLVYAEMSGSRTLEVLLAKDNVFSSESASALLEKAASKGMVISAINGSYFTEYGGGNARLYATVLQDGVLQNGLGESNMLGVTWDGKPYIDHVNYETKVRIGENEIGMWGVNCTYTDPRAIVLLTSKFNQTVTVPTGGAVFTLQEGKITAVAGAGTYTVPTGANLLVYNETAVAKETGYNTYPAVGNSVTILTKATSCHRKEDLEAWNSMRTVSAGGRMLLQNTYNVSRDTSYNGTITEEKQSPDYAASRSFVATMADNRLVFGTATASMYQIAEYLKSVGAVNALGLDGGASTLLYTPDAGYFNTPGRQLASIIAIVEPKESKPDPNTPSAWAESSIAQGKTLGLIPDWLQSNYRSNLTRQEFCVLIVTFLQQKTGLPIEVFREQQGKAAAEAFSDTEEQAVHECAALGIVSGTGEGRFSPEANISRQEAATILMHTAKLLGSTTNGESKTFIDLGSIADWAKEGVDFVTAVGIMNGEGTAFNPQAAYTREQAYITMVNLYHLF